MRKLLALLVLLIPTAAFASSVTNTVGSAVWPTVSGGAGNGVVRSAVDCTAETGGIQNELCVQTADDGIFYCSTATCEGAGWTAIAPGGAGEDQSPWLTDIDGDGYSLLDAGNIVAEISQGFASTTSENAYIGADQAQNGLGWKMGQSTGNRFDSSSLTMDQVWGLTFNCTGPSCSVKSPYQAAYQFNWESSYMHEQTLGEPLLELVTNFFSPIGTWALTAGAAGFADNEQFTVRKTGGSGAVVATGIVVTGGSSPITMNWYSPTDADDPPVAGDTIETSRSTTVTFATGTSFDNHSIALIYPPGDPCTNDNTAIAGVEITATSGADISFIQGWGPLSALTTATNIICSRDVSERAEIGTVSAAADSTTLSGSYTAGDGYARLGPQYVFRPLSQTGVFRFQASKTDNDAGRFAIRSDVYDAGTFPFNKGTASWAALLSTENGANVANGINFTVGDTGNEFISRFHGPVQLYDGDSHYGKIQTTDLTGTRTYTLPDADGTIALTGSAGDMVSTGTSSTGQIPTASDTTGDAYGFTAGLVYTSGAVTIPGSASLGGGVRLRESTGSGASESIVLRGPTSVTATGGQTLLDLTGVTIPAVTAASFATCADGSDIQGGSPQGSIKCVTQADITAASTVTDNAIVRGDGGSRGVQESTVTIADTTGAIAGTESLTLDDSTGSAVEFRNGDSWAYGTAGGKNIQVAVGTAGTGHIIGFLGNGSRTGDSVCTAYGFSDCRFVSDCDAPVDDAAIACVWQACGDVILADHEAGARCE